MKLTHWWRELLVLVVCLLVGNSVKATVHFKDYGMYMVHQPTFNEPYIIVDVLYFDAYDYDSYFTHDATQGSAPGPAVWVDGNYICSPDDELAWDTHQKSANNWRDNNSWVGKTYNTDYATIRFYDPRHEASSGAAEDRYRVYMYIYLKAWECNKKHTIRIKGYWKANGNKFEGWEEMSLTTKAFSDFWQGPSAAKMDEYNTVTVSGKLNTGIGVATSIGVLTDYTSTPSAYKGTAEANKFTVNEANKTASSYEYTVNAGTLCTASGYSYYSPKNVYIQYSCDVSATANNFGYSSTSYGNMKVYKWFSKSVSGFAKATDVTCKTTDQWNKKVELKWTRFDAEGARSTKGTWTIKNMEGDGSILKTGISSSDTTCTVTLPNYDENNIKIYFVPQNLSSNQLRDELATSNIKVKVERHWDYGEVSTSESSNSKIKLNWHFTPFGNASNSNKYTFEIWRSTDNKTFTKMEINGTALDVTSSKTSELSFIDESVESKTTYYYKLKVNVFGEESWSDAVQGKSGGSKVKSFTATRGNYSGMVKLQWTINLVGKSANFIIQRRPLGTPGDSGWADIYSTSGTTTSYSYDDVTALPGSYNDYKLIIWSEEVVNEQTVSSVDDTKTTDGFSVSTGIISGNISYGTGTAVDGVKVTLKPQSANGDVISGMHSLGLNGAGFGLKYVADNEMLTTLLNNSFSIQMYINPNKEAMNDAESSYNLFYVDDDALDIKLKYSSNSYKLCGKIGGKDISSDLNIPSTEWSHLSLAYSQADKNLTYYLTKADGSIQSEIVANELTKVLDNTSPTLFVIGNIDSLNSATPYNGYIDEFRFWTKSLTKQEIQRNYCHLLAGNEDGLAIYYPLDEGISKQTIAYDFSKKNGVSNGRHAVMKVPAISSSEVLPSESQLSLMSFTDVNGYYEIRGVPFTGEGTSYSVIPTMGIHEFSPALKSRYVSLSSLNHSGVDFEDVSSFPVSGTVFYKGTDYPVEGVNFYVDGTICAKDGKIIESDKDGEFTISVPIGDHFITVEKNGHKFTNAGRYPADPNSADVRATFDREIKNMEFIDETLVNFTGRVVGGSIEGEKSVGFGLSHNNIGVAELVLTPLNEVPRMNVVKQISETSYSYETNTVTAPIASATERIASTSWRGAGADDCRKLIIHTDSLTGEFSALVPPLEYKISPIKVVSTNSEIINSVTVDLTNSLIETSDTLYYEDGTYELYSYCTKLKNTYHSDPVFNVKQHDHNDGAFGLKTYTIEDIDKQTKVNDIYTIGNDGKPVYKYGGAVFEMSSPYTFDIDAYEVYTNSDGKTVVNDTVPLSDIIVTIDNALSDQQPVYIENGTVDGVDVKGGQVVDLQSNQLMLDSLGHATYKWKAGFPNITAPYTRTISMTYDIESRTYPWSGNGMPGIILGAMPTGNNFVTSGPDMVDMILRDPPGSKSTAEWVTGTVVAESHSNLGFLNSENHATTTTKLGVDASTIAGAMPGVAKVNNLESQMDLVVGVKVDIEGETGSTWSRTVENTKTISTSDAMEYVGAQGDIFIGTATNIIFGAARNVGFYVEDGSVVLTLKDIISTGLQFGTEFSYTQNYIENVLIPNLIKLRNNMLTHVDSYDGFVNNGKNPVYITTLSPNDPNFGKPNENNKDSKGNILPSSDGPSYKMVVPASAQISKSDKLADNSFQDSIIWCNNQIDAWTYYLALNEKEKVRAYELRNNPDSVTYRNLSFDSGSKVSFGTSTEESNGTKSEVKFAIGAQLGLTSGATIMKTGVLVDVGTETSAGYHREEESTTTEKVSFNYTLEEEGDDDALTVDVFEYGSFSPIFRTRGGQTSAPYEGKVVTKYFEPGLHTLMEATMQIEVPQIDVDVPDVSDIPSGALANYTLRLGNASEIDEDVYYRLIVNDETNPNGANLMIDGKPITDNRIIKIPAGETITKALQLKQTNTGILDYNNIEIVLASQSQFDPTSTWDVIADTVRISAHFVPSSSDVTLALSNSTMNTQTGTDLKLTFKDFDRNYHNLKAFRLQYKRQGATDWTQLKEYVLNESNKTENNELLPATGASVDFTLPMESFSDGEYLFRVVSASTYGTGEVYKYSEELSLIKDLQRPTPLGQPEPADGILDISDDLSVTFNEIILKGELTKTANFKVTGVLNGAEVAHETALSMQNTAATASTEAGINLAGKDFSFDMWVNLAGGAGTLLGHGNGTARLTVGTDADNKLVVNIAGNSYTSDNAVPTGKWAFLTLSYKSTVDGGVLYASVADDANTTNLFVNKTVVKYNGNGPLTVGKNITGAIHELLLWDEAHDMTTALLNRSFTKKPSTRHLIGYWKMDEGEGTSIRDYSRNRHMTMAKETWYMNNVNKSVILNGQGYISIDASKLPICLYDDYALEFWMRGESQSDANLVQMGDIALWVKADGTLQLTGKGANSDAASLVLATSASDMTDNAWHHIALNVLRQGAVAVYVDGVRCLTTNSSNVGSINTNKLIVGARRLGEGVYDRKFTGQIDEIRIWNATMNGDRLIKNRKVRLTGDEDGLIAYYPFEKKGLDSGNQVITFGDATDLCDTLCTAGLYASSDATVPSAITYSDEAPAMRTKPTETNVSFTFVASNEKVVINIDEDPATIEGCTLNFTVRDVRDENGNYSVPAVWSAFVNQKELNWDEDELNVKQQVKGESSVTATIVNKSGTQQMWTLSGMPSWLTASSEYGTTNPLAQSKVTFTVSPATPIGKYQETVYLKSNNGIETPLTLNVTVTGQEPTWSVNMNEFESSMNVIGRVMVQGVPMDDADDIVAAFIGEECRGVAHPVYSARYDSYFVTMDIYGNTEDPNDESGEPVTFRAYDASTGTLYPEVVAGTDIVFESLTLEGSYANPVVLTALNKIEQSTDLKKGWNWLSLYVETDNMAPLSLLSKIADDVEVIKSQNGWLMNEDGNWDGSLTGDLTNVQMYAVKLKNDRTLRLVGEPVNPSTTPITLHHDWNWIGYYGRQIAEVTDALSGMNPEDGYVLKGQNGVAYYDQFEWAGSLMMLEPGTGYMVRTTLAQGATKEFSYPGSTVSLAPRRSQTRGNTENNEDESFMFHAIDFHTYSGNAIMSAKIMNGNAPVVNAELAVFADGECRAVAVTNENGVAYLTIPGDDAATLTFMVAMGAELYQATETLTYETNAVFGSPKNPYVIKLDGLTGVESIYGYDKDESVFDLQGRKMEQTSGDSEVGKGIFIINGQKRAIK